jgi:hypothetical protein
MLDSDFYGLLDVKDQCSNSPEGIPIGEVGCYSVDNRMDDLTTKLLFKSHSISLIKSSKTCLSERAGLLVNYL